MLLSAHSKQLLTKFSQNSVNMTSSQLSSAVPKPRSSPSYSSNVAASAGSGASIQFFLRMHHDGETLIMRANESDTVRSIKLRVHQMKGIPVVQQRFMYSGKELNSLCLLGSCNIENNSTVHLEKLSELHAHPIEEVMEFIFMLCKGKLEGRVVCHEYVTKHFETFLSKIRVLSVVTAKRELDMFMMSAGVSALVLLRNSGCVEHRKTADYCVKALLETFKKVAEKDELCEKCLMILLQLCESLRGTALKDGLYLDCLVVMKIVMHKAEHTDSLIDGGIIKRKKSMNGESSGQKEVVLREITPSAVYWAVTLTEDLKTSIASPFSHSPLDNDMQKFLAFFYSWRKAIKKQARPIFPISLPLDKELSSSLPLCGEEIKLLHIVYSHLLNEMDSCLGKIEEDLAIATEGDISVLHVAGRHHYLTVIRELYRVTRILQDIEDKFWSVMRRRKHAVGALVDTWVDPSSDMYKWLLVHRDMMDFEVRRQLSLALLPRIAPYEQPIELYIDRSQLLIESYTYILSIGATTFRSVLDIKFIYEEATGPGVLREWLCLVCQELFKQRNDLFLSCPNNHRRFYPNPASTESINGQGYYIFSGRMIALALMYRVQVGILFEKSFFLQLAQRSVSLEDIQDADPIFYNSCKIILEMEADAFDSDDLGLTFAIEVEEMGSRSVVELCPGGNNIQVNSQNRKEYVSLLIYQRFVTSTADQAAHFSLGFSSLVIHQEQENYFFHNIELEDLDWMLCGRKFMISLIQWKEHTDYYGYNETDAHIEWFWKIVEEMTPEQRDALLFFWTSVKCLPVEGFSGLGSRLTIDKVTGSLEYLPTSHTCFYKLCLPPYQSVDIMRVKLHIITQQHIGSSFGTV